MNASLDAATMPTPAGAFTVLVDGDGVVASGFTTDAEGLRHLLRPTLRNARLRAVPDAGVVSRAVAAYFAGDLSAIDDVAVSVAGTAHQERVWAALREVPAGTPVTYGELAAHTGSPAAARAIGTACGRNPTALLVPCHRVVRGNGTPGGFAWGADVKRWLLDHERRHAAAGDRVPCHAGF